MRILGLDIQRARDLRGKDRARATEERVQRLEIALAETVEKLEALSGNHAKLRSIVHGDRSVRKPSQSGQMSLDQVPLGDKASLRRVLGVVPGSRYQHQE